MKIPRLFSALAAVRELRRVRIALERQNELLGRLVQRWAPEEPARDLKTVAMDTGVEYVDAVQGGLVLDYIERTRAATGHTPDEDEILIYLADEKTVELQSRLTERDQEIERLQAGRRARGF